MKLTNLWQFFFNSGPITNFIGTGVGTFSEIECDALGELTGTGPSKGFGLPFGILLTTMPRFFPGAWKERERRQREIWEKNRVFGSCRGTFQTIAANGSGTMSVGGSGTAELAYLRARSRGAQRFRGTGSSTVQLAAYGKGKFTSRAVLEEEEFFLLMHLEA